MAQHGQWRQAFFYLGAAGLCYALPYFLFLRTVDEVQGVETKRSQGRLAAVELFKVPTYIMLCLVFPLFLFGLWMLYAWLPNFLLEKFDLSLTEAGFDATIYLQSTTLVGLLGGGTIADRLYRKTKAARLWLLTAALVLCAPCLFLIGNAETLNVTRFAAAGFGLFSGFLMGNIFPAAFEVVPANTRASAVGFLNLFGALVSGFAPLVGGMRKESLGLEGLLAYTSAVYIAAAALLIWTIRFLFPSDHARVQV